MPIHLLTGTMSLPRTIIAVMTVFAQAQTMAHAHIASADDAKEDKTTLGTTPSSPISDHRFFLREIFTKYGHDGQMTFEGFEHLLESLGLGNILISDHDVDSHRESLFRDTHATHHHPKEHSNEQKKEFPGIGSTPPSSFDATNANSTAGTRYGNPNTIPKDEYKVVTEEPTKVTPPLSTESVFHYSLRDDKIPELLTNLSTLVDQHRETESLTPEIVIDQCLTPKEILDTFGLNQTSSLNPVSFLHLCPAIIYELDQGHCIFRDTFNSRKQEVPTIYQWAYAVCAVSVISLCGLFSVASVPLITRCSYRTLLLQFLVGLAVGSLSGDALLHLLPHALLSDDSGHSHHAPPEYVERRAKTSSFISK